MSKKMGLLHIFISTRMGLTSIFMGATAVLLCLTIFCGALSSPAWYAAAALLGLSSIMSVATVIWIARLANRYRARTLVPGDVDRFQAIYRTTFRLFPLTVLLYGIGCIFGIWVLLKSPEKHWPSLTFGVTSMLMFLLSWTQAKRLWGRGRNAYIRRILADEFFQNNLAQARGEGFAAALTAMPICFLVGLYEPRIGISLLPFAALVSVAVAGWRFSRRDARAAEDDGA